MIIEQQFTNKYTVMYINRKSKNETTIDKLQTEIASNQRVLTDSVSNYIHTRYTICRKFDPTTKVGRYVSYFEFSFKFISIW